MKKISKKNQKLIIFSSVGILLVLVISFFTGFAVYKKNLYSKPTKVLTQLQQDELSQILKTNFPEQIIRPLPYNVITDTLPLHAKSSIAVNFESSCILYEKNAEEQIPPASMTKLVLMYVALDQIAQGKANFDDIVPLPRECWAINAPPHSSLMFLGEGQKVTLDEILTGLNVVSGNDAAVAIAIYLFGSVDNCIEKMNEAVKDLGLKNTKFVEVSGYSEENLTTAKDFVTFCVQYVKKFPFALQKYHSIKSFTYPKEKNLPEGWTIERSKSEGVTLNGTLPITQRATNGALDAIPGADGLKTGYIYESGYNLALSVVKNGSRLISVTMGGAGSTHAEGNKFRTEDAITISDWAFKAFSSVPIQNSEIIRFSLPGASKYSCNLLEIPQGLHYLCIPNMKNSKDKSLTLQKKIVIFDEKLSSVECGNQYGQVEYYYGNYLVEKIPLVSDRTVKKGNIFRQIYAGMLK